MTLASRTLLPARFTVAFWAPRCRPRGGCTLCAAATVGASQANQFGLPVVAIAAVATVCGLREQLIGVFYTNAELNLRLRLGAQMRSLISLHELEEWGWADHWRRTSRPTRAFSIYSIAPRHPTPRLPGRLAPTRPNRPAGISRPARPPFSSLVAARLPPAKFRRLPAGTRARRPTHHLPRRERDPGGIRMAHLRGLIGKGHARAALAAGVRCHDAAGSDSVSRDHIEASRSTPQLRWGDSMGG